MAQPEVNTIRCLNIDYRYGTKLKRGKKKKKREKEGSKGLLTSFLMRKFERKGQVTCFLVMEGPFISLWIKSPKANYSELFSC